MGDYKTVCLEFVYVVVGKSESIVYYQHVLYKIQLPGNAQGACTQVKLINQILCCVSDQQLQQQGADLQEAELDSE